MGDLADNNLVLDGEDGLGPARRDLSGRRGDPTAARAPAGTAYWQLPRPALLSTDRRPPAVRFRTVARRRKSLFHALVVKKVQRRAYHLRRHPARRRRGSARRSARARAPAPGGRRAPRRRARWRSAARRRWGMASRVDGEVDEHLLELPRVDADRRHGGPSEVSSSMSSPMSRRRILVDDSTTALGSTTFGSTMALAEGEELRGGSAARCPRRAPPAKARGAGPLTASPRAGSRTLR